MKGKALMAVGTVIYVVAWFMPTVEVDLIPFVSPGTIPGWGAFRIALSGFGPPWSALSVLLVASVLSNMVVVVALVLVFIARRSPPRFLRVMLVASAVLNTWFVLDSFRGDLRIGYYLWASSFFVIAAGSILEGQRGESRRALSGTEVTL